MTLPAFVKIFALGDRNTKHLFDNPIEVTEKVDGSQISWRVSNGNLEVRSKNAAVNPGDGNKMFATATEVLNDLRADFDDGFVYHGEYLQKPKHNTLTYGRVPKQHIAWYGVRNADGDFLPYTDVRIEAEARGFEAVPLLYQGELADDTSRMQFIEGFMDRESFLGGPKMEGLVVKNYQQQVLIGGQVIPILCGKWVSEAFKEKHKVEWKAGNPSKQEQLAAALKSTARWEKAIQRLREQDKLTDSPKDIGPLIAGIKQDIEDEERAWIMDWLWKMNHQEILRMALGGFPEWYKSRLVEHTFDKEAA
jgi:hypothetical protein